MLLRSLATYLYIFSAILLVPLTISFRSPVDTKAFFYTLLCTLGAALLCHFSSMKSKKRLLRREGLLLVALIWILTPAFAALPFHFSNALPSFNAAYFEMCSGLTTTGMTVIDNIEGLSVPLLFWRSFVQWLGGIGIVLLLVAIFPTLEVGGKLLFQSEAAGPLKESLTPRIQGTASSLFKIYCALTLICLLALLFTNSSLTLFDAITLTFAAVSSGGFTVRNHGMLAYQNSATEWILILFMILGTINFSLYYYFLKGKFSRLKQPELITYLILLVFFAGLISLQLPSTMLRQGIFQAVSTLSTTGFAIDNYDLWPQSAQALLLVSMFIGGMSGSTSGSIKVIRHYLLSRLSLQKIQAFFNPSRVQTLVLEGTKIDTTTASSLFTFFFLYLAVAVLSTLFFIFDGIDHETAFGLTASLLNNIGCAFRQAGPFDSCSFLSPLSKAFASFLMLLGRLELFLLLALFLPSFWRRRV